MSHPKVERPARPGQGIALALVGAALQWQWSLLASTLLATEPQRHCSDTRAPSTTHLGPRRHHGAMEKRDGGEEQGHVRLVPGGPERLVQQEVKQAVHALLALEGEQGARPGCRNRGLHGDEGMRGMTAG